MMTLPDFREKKLLFVNANDDLENNLRFIQGNICLYESDVMKQKISCHLVISIFIIGRATLTTILIKNAKKYGISIFLLTDSLETYAEIVSLAEGHYVLRHIQYTMKEEKEMEIARFLILNKAKSQYESIKKKRTLGIEKTLYENWQSRITKANDCKSLLGVEGSIAIIFENMNWHRRTPQIKEDITNLLLDIGYTFLFHYVDSLLRLFGFDTYKGVYHKLFFQRKSLSCDIMEPLRPLIDYELSKAHNLGQIISKDFICDNGIWKFQEPSYKTRQKYSGIFLKAITERKEDIYLFVYGYYRFVSNSEKYPFSPFLL